ncbi:uncharacterized protein LOC114326483 [Diabrotica virgifera virgifera]|uniref:Uncharacterized protein LOC114326483 n=1 Tax=Diabrotica virgifera virgifera TaxID=50390 RepID=A0A6P7F4R6_DIAVI|nr:uncharacterized protein LOC114326483 [Diabrotica virgifera virgifera]
MQILVEYNDPKMNPEEIDETGETAEDAEGGAEEQPRFRIQRVLIKPGKSLAVHGDENLATRLPHIPEDPKAYTPMPYVFRVPTTSIPTKIVNLLARSPPFHLLLDHTIAVIWLLFGQGEYDSPLGIGQLQWALAFLKTVQTGTGDYTQDVARCIETIENILINNYADLNNDIGPASRLDETVRYGGGALGSSTMITQEIPFSLNYSEIISKGPLNQYVSEQIMSMTSVECEQELEKLKQAGGVDSIENLDTVSREKAVNVLRMWKSDQVKKIRGDLRRLRSIEDKMRDIDASFSGYLEDHPEGLLGVN